MFPVLTELKPHTRQAELFEQVNDFNTTYRMNPTLTRSEMTIKPSTVPTPVISGSLTYPWDELQTINDGKLPIDQRARDMAINMQQTEDRIALSEALAIVDGIAVTGVKATGTNSVAAATEFNASTYPLAISTLELMIGQIIDGLKELSDPLVFCVTPDIYKSLRGAENANTDANAIREIEARLKEVNPNSSGVISSAWLGGTPTLNANKLGFTDGTTNAVLMNWNPQFYHIQESIMEIRENPITKINGLVTQWVRRWRPIYRKKEAIIYSATAVE